MYGPYKRRDGRSHVIWIDDNGNRRTQSYPRYLMELHLGRELLSTEHVDHINNDPTDNRIENLQLLDQASNNRKSSLNTSKYYSCICAFCGIEFQREARYYEHNQVKQGKAGPYCSRSCAGKVHH